MQCFILLPATLLVKVASRHTPKFQSVAYCSAGPSYSLGVERLGHLRLEYVGGGGYVAYVGGSTEMKSWSVFGTCMVSGIRRVEKVRELEWVMGQVASDGREQLEECWKVNLEQVLEECGYMGGLKCHTDNHILVWHEQEHNNFLWSFSDLS